MVLVVLGLEDRATMGLHDRVCAGPLMPRAALPLQAAEGFNARRIGARVPDVMLTLEEAEDLRRAILLIPSCPLVEGLPCDGAVAQSVDPDVSRNSSGALAALRHEGVVDVNG